MLESVLCRCNRVSVLCHLNTEVDRELVLVVRAEKVVKALVKVTDDSNCINEVFVCNYSNVNAVFVSGVVNVEVLWDVINVVAYVSEKVFHCTYSCQKR